MQDKDAPEEPTGDSTKRSEVAPPSDCARCKFCGRQAIDRYGNCHECGEKNPAPSPSAPATGPVRYCADTSKDLKVPDADPSCHMRCIVHDVEIAALRESVKWHEDCAVNASNREAREKARADAAEAEVERLDFQRNHLDTMVTALTMDVQSAERHYGDVTEARVAALETALREIAENDDHSARCNKARETCIHECPVSIARAALEVK